MATWGEFIAEIPIINKRSEGIFVKADHVLDLWEERNRLRAELAMLKSSSGEAEPAAADAPVPLAAPVAEEGSDAAAEEREQCAREIEEFAQTCPVDPAWREFAVQLLQTAAQLLREKSNPKEADFLDQVVIPPPALAEEVSPETAPPMAEPVTEEMPPMAEPVADDQPFLPR